MRHICKGFSLLLIAVLAILSLTIVKPTGAFIPKPSIPEFTVQLADHSYDVPPTTTSTTNPYTNKTTIKTNPGYHVQKITIDITIKNQPFPSTIGGNTTNLYYNVRSKGHFGENWREQFSQEWSSSKALPTQSDSEYTVISLPKRASGDQIDFQVQATLGYHYKALPGRPLVPLVDAFAYATSDWSPTVTFTMPDASAYTSPKPTSISLSVDSLLKIAITIAIIALTVALFSLLLCFKHLKKKIVA